MSPFFAPLIAVHAVAGILSLALAATLILQPGWMRPAAVRSVWLVLMAVVVTFLIGAVIVGWPSMELPRRLTNAGLLVLAAYTLLRAAQAAAVARRVGPRWEARMLDHLGFAAISLFDGFVIVGAIRAGLPGWVVLGIGVGGVAAGIAAVEVRKRRLLVRQVSP